MFPYSLLQLLFFFFCYCFIGWIIESSWVSLHKHRFVNRGFMRGPFIPIYGFGAMALLIVGTLLIKWPVAVFFGGLLTASVLEFFTGMAMEAIFKVRYWDYSDKPFNIKGHVCLFTSICWGLLAVVEVYFLHKPLEHLSQIFTGTELELITYGLSVYFGCDLSLSFKAAFDLRDIIIKMEEAREDLRLMQKRLDVILAYAKEDADDFIEERIDRVEDIADNIEARFNELRRRIETKPSEYAEDIREEFEELREKLRAHRLSHFGFTEFKDRYKRRLLLGNPTMMSKKFKFDLERIKEFVDKK